MLLLLLLLLAGGGGDGGVGEAGDVDGGSSTGAAGCSKRCAASLSQCVVPLSLKENKNLYQIKSQYSEITYDHESVLRIRDVYPGSRILIFTHPGSRISDPGSKDR
jgi:hypothetical protein